MRRIIVLFVMLMISGMSITTLAAQQAGWQEFTSSEGNFSIMMPGTPKLEKGTTEGRPFQYNAFSLSGKPHEYVVSYVDFPSQPNEQKTQEMFDRGRDNAVGDGKLINESPISLNGYPGRAYKFETTEGQIVNSRIYQVKQRFYTLAVESAKGSGDSQDIEKFLASFKLLSVPDKAVATWQEFSPKAGKFTVLMPGVPSTMKQVRQAQGEQIDQFMFPLELGEVSYMVSYTSFPVLTIDEQLTEKVFNGGRDALIATEGGKLISETAITLNGNRGKAFIIEMPDGLNVQLRIYIAGTYVYQLLAETKNIKEHSADIDKFFNSFKLIS